MTDEQMLGQRAQEDLRHFASLYDRYAERIYAYAQRELQDVALAQDVVSATFEKALKNLPHYRWLSQYRWHGTTHHAACARNSRSHSGQRWQRAVN